MSYFDLDPAGAESARQNAILNPLMPGDMGPGFFSGAGEGTARGVLQGTIAQPAMALADFATPKLTPLARSLDDMFGLGAEDWLKSEQKKTHEAVHNLMPGPQIGTLGQIGYGAGSVLPQAAAGFAVAGPLGAAGLTGYLQGHSAAVMGEEYEGLDPATAQLKGTLEGIFAGAGVLLPAGVTGSLIKSIAVGAGGNVGLGMVQRQATHELLKRGGYAEMAEQYKAMDATAVLTDLVLGGGFGVLAARGAKPGEAPPPIPPTLTDSVLADNKAAHLQGSTAPGAPVDPASVTAHSKAVNKAVADVLADKPVEVADTGVTEAAFVANRAELEAAVTKAVHEGHELRTTLDALDEIRARAEEAGITPADDPLFEGRKLQQAADALDAAGAREPAGATIGRDGEVFVGSKAEPVRFLVVEADALAATISKDVNQFRDRTRAASQQQIAAIANDLQFGRLGEAPSMAEGAPTIAVDGETIVGGNGRVAAVQRAYEIGRGEAYRVALEQRAAEFGLTAADVQGFSRPILVRQFTQPIDVKMAAILSNEAAGLKMSALEQAKVDATRMPDLAGVEMPESGDIGAASLRSFVNQWLSKYPQSELGEFVGADGRLSPSGEMRLRNAILHQAYGDTPTLARLIEATDDLSKNLTNALVKSAANVAEARALIADGSLHDLDIQQQLLQAVDVTQRLRADGMKLETWLDQGDMFGTGVGPESVMLMQHFAVSARSAKATAAALTGYYDAVRALGDPRQESMFAAQPPARADILRAVLNKRPVEDPVALRQGERAADPAMMKLAPEQRGVLLEVFAAAEKEKPGFDQAIAKIAEELGGAAKLAPIKGVARSVEKIAADYGGDASKIKDTLRATIEIDSAENAQAAVGAIFEQFDVLESGRRNLLDPAKQPVDGYRDAKFNVKVGDVIAEVHVNLPAMLEAKKAAHALYEERAAIERAHKDVPLLPDEVQARIDRLNAEMRAIYEPAWTASTKALNSSSETGAPLRLAESASKGRGGETSQAAAKGKPSTPEFSETGMPSTSNSSARGEKAGSSISASEAIVPDLAETATSGVGSRQVLDDMPNALVIGEDGAPAPAGLAIRQADAKIAMSESDSAAFPAAAACALR